jgi:hypothetical protein
MKCENNRALSENERLVASADISFTEAMTNQGHLAPGSDCMPIACLLQNTKERCFAQ